MMNKIPDFPIKKKPGRPKKNPQVSELDRLKNLIARQDDLIAQLQDDLKDAKAEYEVLDQDIGELEDKIESYREIIKTLMEITE